MKRNRKPKSEPTPERALRRALAQCRTTRERKRILDERSPGKRRRERPWWQI